MFNTVTFNIALHLTRIARVDPIAANLSETTLRWTSYTALIAANNNTAGHNVPHFLAVKDVFFFDVHKS
jgi:hypothetical protein